jgi:hypothetical protein
VQEVLAEGEYRIGYYYYVKGDKRASAARLLTVTSRYPLYSKSDQALWMMGDIFASSEHKDVASLYYARIVKDYPLSNLAPQAKDKLKASGVPVPQADPNALAWMTAEQNTPRPHTPLYKKPLDLMKSGPNGEFLTAARTGTPNMQPESDTLSAGDLLTPGGKQTTGAGAPGTGIVATVVPGTAGTTGTAETVGGSESTAPTANDGTASVPATSEPPKEAGTELTPAAVAPTAVTPATPTPSTATNEETAKNPTAAGATETPAKSDPATTETETKSDTTAPGTASAADAAKTGDSQNSDDSKKESSSKKKKGLRKLVPW